MKFSKGMWFWEEDVTAILPSQVVEVETTDTSLTVYAPQKAPTTRLASLSSPMISVRYSSPLVDVIRVEVTHFAGGQAHGPHFELQTAAPEVEITENDASVALRSGALSVHVAKDQQWLVTFKAEGRILTGSGSMGMGYFRRGDGSVYMREQLNLLPDAFVYGLGERFGPLVKNGQSIDMWNSDPGTGTDLAYKNVPFYLTNKGYGVFVNSPDKVSFEVATERVSRVSFSQPGEVLEYLIIYGPTPQKILEKYTALTGRPALPPAWSFGLWLTTSFLTDYNEATVTTAIQGMADRNLPLHVFHFDCFWMKGYHWCDFTWDKAMFPDPVGVLARLHARGLKTCVWINPYIAQRSVLFEEGKAHGFLLQRPNGDVWQTDEWQSGMAIVDFTNPAAANWYGEKLRALMGMGVDSFKTDFGERIPTDVVYYDGSDPRRAHNYYTYLYNKTVFDVLREVRGDGEAAVFARSATAGCQQFPVHWGGDCEATYESMADSLRGGLSLCASGFGFWSHDISGFEHTATPDLYKRWTAFGLLSSHSRLHGNQSYRVPWNFDDEAVEVLRFFTNLKCRLMPYLYQVAYEATQTGMPMMRAMVLEFPDDPACSHLERQYMLGPSLLVAPIFNEHGTADYYLPAGRWTQFFTGKVCEGGRWMHDEAVGYLSIPLWVREDTVLPLGANDQRPDYDYANDVTLHCYQLMDDAATTLTIPNTQGNTSAIFCVHRTRDRIIATRKCGQKAWSVEIAGHGAMFATADTEVVEIDVS